MTLPGNLGVTVLDSVQVSGLCARLQRFLTYSDQHVGGRQADDAMDQDDVTRRQSIMFDMDMVGMLGSISCNLEQFNPNLSHAHISSDPEEGHIRHLCASCFQVLRLLARKNPIIGVQLSDSILHLVEPLEYLAAAHNKAGISSMSHVSYLSVMSPIYESCLLSPIYESCHGLLSMIHVSYL